MISKIPSVGMLFCGSIAAYSMSKRVHANSIDCHECRVKRLPKARELPLYEKEDDQFTVEYNKASELPLITEISKVRSQLMKITSYLDVAVNKASHIYETGLAHSQSTLDYINDEEKPIPRILTIASAGFVGIILARKSGYFKKIVYASTCSGLMFSALYPATAKEYFSYGYEFTKEHTGNALEKYGGYDTKKLAESANEKAEYLKSAMKLEGLTTKLKEQFEKNKEAIMQKINSVNKGKDEKEPSKTPE